MVMLSRAAIFAAAVVLASAGCATASVSATAGADIKPAAYPLRASYTVRLNTSPLSKECANCTFVGKHYYDATDMKQQRGLVDL